MTVFLAPRWLISKSADLTFLIGSVLVTWLLFGLWRASMLTTLELTMIWIFALHGPHFWGTWTRTLLDRATWKERGGMYGRSFLWFLVGPAMVGAGWFVGDRFGRPELWMLFFFLAGLWAYHHVVKQHFGFVALYRAKHGEFDRREFTWHKWYLIVSLWLPMLIVLTNEPSWLIAIPGVQWYADAGGGARILAASRFVRDWTPVVFVALQAAFVLGLLSRLARGRGVNLPQLLLLVACVPLHWFVVTGVLSLPPGEAALGFYALVPLVTSYHNIQYHALIWHYNKVRYHSEGAAERHGLAAAVNKNLAFYVVLGLAYTAVTIGVEHYGFAFFQRRDMWYRIVVAALWGWSFQHYWIDSKIWHVRQDADLRRTLGFPEPPA